MILCCPIAVPEKPVIYSIQIHDLFILFLPWKLYLVFALIDFVAAASSHCTQQPYAALAQLSVYPPIKSYCLSRYPAASCSTASTSTTSKPPLVGAAPASVTTLTSTSTVFLYTTTTITRTQSYCFQLPQNEGAPLHRRAVSTIAGATPTTQVAMTITGAVSPAGLILSSFMLLGGDIISNACGCIAGVKACTTAAPQLIPRQKVIIIVTTKTSTIYTATSAMYTSVNVCA